MSHLNSCASKETSVIISPSISSANIIQNSNAVLFTISIHRTSSLAILLTVTLAGAFAFISVVESVTSADRFGLEGVTFLTVSLERMFLINDAFTEVSEFGLIALQLTEISVSITVITTSRHENIRAVLAALVKAWAFSHSLSKNSYAFLGAGVIIGQTVNTANRSIFLLTVTRG